MERKIVEPMTVIYVAQEVAIPEVRQAAETWCAQIAREVGKHGLHVSGPWVFVSYGLPKNGKDRYRVEFCLPVSNGDTYAGGTFAVKTLARFACACAGYQGRMRHLFTRGYQPLVAEMVLAKLGFTGESREVYYAWHGPDSEDNRMEIQFGTT